MVRSLHASMQAEVIKPQIKPVWIVRLDIETDPVYAWTGRGQFTAAGTGDAALDGYTFEGVANFGEISAIKEDNTGSGMVSLKLAGVNVTEEVLDQIINNAYRWQGRRAYMWIGMLNEQYGVVANPTRIKTGLMNQLKLVDGGETATVMLTIESHQAFISRATRTRYITQIEIDPNDLSQTYIHDLANRSPPIGEETPRPSIFGGLPLPGFPWWMWQGRTG